MSELELDNFEAAAEQAIQDGMEVLVAGGYELFLDLDSVEQEQRWEAMRQQVVRFYPFEWYETWKSRNGNTHVRIKLKPHLETSLPERVGLQLILGSDSMKELLTLARYQAGVSEEGLVRLFRPRMEAVERVTDDPFADLEPITEL